MWPVLAGGQPAPAVGGAADELAGRLLSDIQKSDSKAVSPEDRQLRVLALEDSPADFEMIMAVLRQTGYRIRCEQADSPSKLRERLESAPCDIILTEFNMRSWTAFDALEVLKESGRDVPLLVVTGALLDEAAVELLKRGACDYILKDRLARLPAAVERVLREKAAREGQKQAEISLVRLRQAVNASGEVVMMTDPEGIFTFINSEFTRLYGYSEAEVVGKTTPRILKSDRVPRKEYADFWRALLEKRPFHWEIVNRTKARREVTVESSVSPILDEGGNIAGFLGIQRDITERRKLEQQFRQAQKMEAVGRLAGGVAHDFNNLLTVINGFSDLLLSDGGLGAEQQSRVEEIRKAGERAAGLTRQLLAFSRQQILQPAVLDLNDVVSNVTKMLGRLIGEDVDLALVPAKGLSSVKADPGQIEQVLMNLAVNARDAMPEGGKLTIETANVELDQARASAYMLGKAGPYVMLAMSDTGHGMDAATLAHVFEPFFTTKEKGKGTGLGLATVYGIVKQSCGSIWVYSEPGHGTTFKIYFPAVEDARASARPFAPPAERNEEGGGSETILLVEDEAAVRSFAEGLLRAKGYQVLEANGGEAALRIARQTRSPIQLLLTDLVMPNMSGRELARELSSIHPEAKSLFMSGYTDEAVVRNGSLLPGQAFIQKPFTRETMTRKVRELLDVM